MASFEVFCPSCDGAAYVEPEDAGQVATCPHCGAAFTVPAPAAPTGPAKSRPARARPPGGRSPAGRRPPPRRPASRRPEPRRQSTGRPEPRGSRRGSGPNPAVLGGLAVLTVIIAAVVYFGLGGDKPPVAASFAQVHSGRIEAKRRVTFDAVLHPIGLLEARPQGEKPRYYAVLLSRKGKYFQRLKEASVAVDKWLAEEVPIFEKAFRNGYGYGRATKEFEELEDLVEKAIELDGSEKVVGIRLQNFEPVAALIEWESFTVPTPGDWKPFNIDFEGLLSGMRENRPIAFDRESRQWTLEDLRIRIERLSAECPPDLGKELPDLGRGYSGPEDEELAQRVSDLYNAEVLRRQDYVLLSMEERAHELRIGVRQILSLANRRVNARIEPRERGLDEFFSRGGLPRVPVIVMEETVGQTFAATDFKTTYLHITSYPPDAEVRMDGRNVGRTPLAVGGVAVGKTVSLDFRLAGHDSVSLPATVKLTPDGFVRVEAVLRPE